MVGGILLTIWLSAHGADLVSSHAAQNRVQSVEANPLLPPNGVLNDSILIGSGVAGGLSTRYLWNHGHKTAALSITILDTLLHGWAIKHNLGLK